MLSLYLLVLFVMVMRSDIGNLIFWTRWWAIFCQSGWFPAGILCGVGLLILKYKGRSRSGSGTALAGGESFLTTPP